MKKKIMHLSNKLRPDLDIRIFTKPPPSTQAFFQIKDPIVKHMQSDVVYFVKCNDCEHSYIGKTERQCIRRLYEHGAPKTTFSHQQQCIHVNNDSNDDLNNDTPELRRSSRLENKATAALIATALTTAPIIVVTTTTSTTAFIDNNDKNTISSSIHQHQEETGHNMNWTDFRVVCQDNHSYRLLIKESLLIKAYEPELNKTTHSVPLIVFPDGLPRALLPNPH